MRNSEGHITKETGWFENLITNNGLDLIITSPAPVFQIKSFIPGCYVGTGSAAPAFTDTTLQAYLAGAGQYGADTDHITVTGPPLYWTRTRHYRFGTGVAAGNLSEVGVGSDFNNLFSRALIKDAFGVPTTITVLADEVLDVSYTLRVYPPVTDSTFNMVVNGSNVSVTARGFALNGPGLVIDAIASNSPFRQPPALNAYHTGTTLGNVYTGVGFNGVEYGGNGGQPDYTAQPPYISGTYYCEGICSFGLPKAAGSNSLWILEWPQGRYQFKVATPIVKTGVQSMDISYRISWGRYP
ncbi:MAG: hypothetical protein V4649_19565 [Bacteroidota bacterium]